MLSGGGRQDRDPGQGLGVRGGVRAAGRPGGAGVFCLPRHPRQRGTNENTNGPLREYLPKGTDLSAVSDEEVRKAYDGLNRRPRKRYGWRCPWEVYHGEALHLL